MVEVSFESSFCYATVCSWADIKLADSRLIMHAESFSSVRFLLISELFQMKNLILKNCAIWSSKYLCNHASYIR